MLLKHITLNIGNIVLMFTFIFISLFTTIILITDFDKPLCYKYIFLLPLSFIIFSLIFHKLYYIIPNNIGISLILSLLFIRNTISPLFMAYGSYYSSININIDNNSFYAIFLIIYESFFLFFTLYIFAEKGIGIKTNETNNFKSYNELSENGQNKYFLLIILVLLILFFCYIISPEFSFSYRSIFHIKDEYFTSIEDSYYVKKYGTTFLKKLCMVVGNYIMRIMILIVPTALIAIFSKNKSILNKLISFLLCFIPFFFIAGAIARSLIYTICLLLLRDSIFSPKYMRKHIVILAICSIIAIILYWTMRAEFNTASTSSNMSVKFSAYFSGVNVVSGVFNLPRDFWLKLKYFILDFTTTLPFGNTIFGTSNEITVSSFFNLYNDSYGQIPPTIGMGYYYFGFVLSPIYSIIFSIIACKFGEKILNYNYNNPFQFIRYIYTIFVFSMGIIMYNIEITLTNTFCILIPMFLMEKIAYGKK